VSGEITAEPRALAYETVSEMALYLRLPGVLVGAVVGQVRTAAVFLHPYAPAPWLHLSSKRKRTA
jgi:hypothetical protein